MRTDESEIVVLRSQEHNAEIHGQLTNDTGSSVCVVVGSLVGVDEHSIHSFHPEDLVGYSSKRGQLWLERVHVNSMAKHNHVDDVRLTTIRLRAAGIFWGDFDPRTTLVSFAASSLGELTPLALQIDPRIRREGEVSYFDSGAEVLLETSEFKLSILAPPWERHDHSHTLAVEFPEGKPHSLAIELLEQVAALISLLTSSSLSMSEILFASGEQRCSYRRVGGPSPLYGDYWLLQPNEILLRLRSMLPGWLTATSSSLNLYRAQVFLSMRKQSTLEGSFLYYCQCFEDLNIRRRPMPRLLDEDVFQSKIVDVLRPVVDGLGPREIRRRLLDTIQDANRPTMEQRLKRAFSSPPRWLARVQEHMPHVLGQITTRRNQLSHGDPQGAVLSDRDAQIIYVEIDLMFLFCLAELLLLTGIDESEAISLTSSSEEAWQAPLSATKVPKNIDA